MTAIKWFHCELTIKKYPLCCCRRRSRTRRVAFHSSCISFARTNREERTQTLCEHVNLILITIFYFFVRRSPHCLRLIRSSNNICFVVKIFTATMHSRAYKNEEKTVGVSLCLQSLLQLNSVVHVCLSHKRHTTHRMNALQPSSVHAIYLTNEIVVREHNCRFLSSLNRCRIVQGPKGNDAINIFILSMECEMRTAYKWSQLCDAYDLWIFIELVSRSLLFAPLGMKGQHEYFFYDLIMKCCDTV